MIFVACGTPPWARDSPMIESQHKADSDDWVFVESYGDYLPRSDLIPTARPTNGVSGISHDGDVYCVDCAIDMDLIDESDLEKHSRELGPWTGIVLPSHETDILHHCGNHRGCINSTTEHPYDHDEPIGIGIEEKTIQH